MTRIIEKTLTQLEDRVDHGEATGKLDADGNPVKLPMRGRDLAVAGAIIFDKRQLLRSHPTSISAGAGLSDLAAKLVQAFQSVVQRNEKTVDGTAERIMGGDSSRTGVVYLRISVIGISAKPAKVLFLYDDRQQRVNLTFRQRPRSAHERAIQPSR